YEFRWIAGGQQVPRPNRSVPRWSGQNLAGKTILLQMEQGFGDAIQFLRFAPHLKRMGATVAVHVPETMSKLAQRFVGVDHVIDNRSPMPELDFHIPLLSLPRVLQVDIDSIPYDVPYVQADENSVERWKRRLGDVGGVQIGIAWAGNPGHTRDRQRSIPFQTLLPLLETRGARFVSLQKGQAASELAALGSERGVLDIGDELEDFGDTAAAISYLDLVICADTAVAHLAGALGKPVWLLVPKPSDWRWMETREDSPWYPTMRIFRQAERNDWSGVVDRVAEALEEEIRSARLDSRLRETPLRATPPTHVSRDATAASAPRRAFSVVSETRLGILQYFPDRDRVGR